MDKNFGKADSYQTPQLVLEGKAFKKVIEMREIKPEDLFLIEKLSSFPKDFFIDFHNFFSFSGNNTLRDLEKARKKYQNELEKGMGDKVETENRIKFLEAFIEFAKKYNSFACDHLNRAFENRKV